MLQAINMRRVFAVLVAIQLSVAPVWACCWASAGDPVWMKSEKAIIIWNAARKIEHFIRQVDFDTDAKDFGFIVPLPSVPDFGVAKEGAFEILEGFYQHEMMKGMDPAPASAVEAIEILKTEQVGDYLATVVRASDGQAMNDWLGRNGFKSRPQMTEWLNHYTKKQWVFAALKYAAQSGATTKTKAIRISFKTDKPHYPYKMPSDAFRRGWVRPIRLYVVASSGIDARFAENGDGWVGKRLWSGSLTNSYPNQLAESVELGLSEIPEKPVLTIFRNAETESKYDEDLIFTASINPAPWIWGGVVLVAVLGWAVTQRNRRRFIPNPA